VVNGPVREARFVKNPDGGMHDLLGRLAVHFSN